VAKIVSVAALADTPDHDAVACTVLDVA